MISDLIRYFHLGHPETNIFIGSFSKIDKSYDLVAFRDFQLSGDSKKLIVKKVMKNHYRI